MATPPDHLVYLRQRGFAPPTPEAFTEEEAAQLSRFGHWLDALCRGLIEPVTPEQRHFLEVARGEGAPSTQLERIWVEVQNQREAATLRQESPGDGPRLGHFNHRDPVEACLAELREAKHVLADLSKQRDTDREAVLSVVRDQLDAVEAQYAARLESANQLVRDLEEAVKEGALRLGRSVQAGDVRVVYSKGRTTWDSKGLAEYAEHNPEVAQFRKVGKPTAYIRYPSSKEE